jgi:hypothetical protein
MMSAAPFSSLIVRAFPPFGGKEALVPTGCERISIQVYDSSFYFIVEWRGDILSLP